MHAAVSRTDAAACVGRVELIRAACRSADFAATLRSTYFFGAFFASSITGRATDRRIAVRFEVAFQHCPGCMFPLLGARRQFRRLVTRWGLQSQAVRPLHHVTLSPRAVSFASQLRLRRHAGSTLASSYVNCCITLADVASACDGCCNCDSCSAAGVSVHRWP